MELTAVVGDSRFEELKRAEQHCENSSSNRRHLRSAASLRTRARLAAHLRRISTAQTTCRADMGLGLFGKRLRLVGSRDPFWLIQVWSSFPVLDKESFLVD